MNISTPSVALEGESFIGYVADDDLDPRLRTAFEPHIKQLGFTPNALKLYAHRPEIAETLLALNWNIMRDSSSTLPLGLKRKIAVICSTINGSSYCTAHSCTILKRQPTGDPLLTEGWGVDEVELRSLIDGSDAPVDDVERVCFAYARAASEDPTEVPTEVLSDLKETLSSPQIMELACAVGFWKFFNTVNDSLHIPVESSLAGDSEYLNLVSR